MISHKFYLSRKQRFEKRTFDIFFAIFGLFLFWWLILISFLFSTIIHRENGFFTQTRIGRFAKRFKILKIRTMRSTNSINTSVTTEKDPRITILGRFLRLSKIDELPQLINVLLGEMSFVGPRPDVEGFADELKGDDRKILELRPGITSQASLTYKDEEKLLSQQANPEKYNRLVIWPKKIKMNLLYIKNYSLLTDIKIIIKTILNIRE